MTPSTATAPTAPALHPHVSPVEGVAQTLTLAWRTIVQVRHNPWELGDFSIQPIMFVLLFTYVFGGAIAGSTGEYLTYALPGIIVMNMLFVTMYVGTGLNTDLTKGVFDRLRSLPIARWAPVGCGRPGHRPGRSSSCSPSMIPASGSAPTWCPDQPWR
jgi:oleandomycin transport system permease protein